MREYSKAAAISGANLALHCSLQSPDLHSYCLSVLASSMSRMCRSDSMVISDASAIKHYFTQVQSEPVPECRLCGHPVCDPCQQQVRFFNCDIDKYRYSQYLEKVSTISLLKEPMSILFIYFIYLLVKFSSSTIQQSLTYLVILMFSNMKDNC